MNFTQSRIPWVLLASLFFVALVGIGVYLFPQQNLVIHNQDRAFTITVDKAYFPKGGFIVVNRQGIVAESLRLMISEYFPPGEYKDFSLSYVMTTLDEFPSNSYDVRAVMREDVNNNKQFDRGDAIVRNKLGKAIAQRFTLFQKEIVSVGCGERGFSEDFSSENIDRIRWAPSVQNVQRNGLLQTAQYNGPNAGATTLYTRNMFYGDVEAEMEVVSFSAQENVPGFSGKVELIFESPQDRVLSVQWVKNDKGSYVVPQGSYLSTQVFEPHPVSSGGPIGMRLRRKGAVGEIWINEGSGYQKLWELPANIEDIYMGILTADDGQSSQLVSSQVSKSSISCPTE
jgi:hypothetical protein